MTHCAFMCSACHYKALGHMTLFHEKEELAQGHSHKRKGTIMSFKSLLITSAIIAGLSGTAAHAEAPTSLTQQMFDH